MLFHWTGSEVVVSTFGGLKVNALRARPDVAIRPMTNKPQTALGPRTWNASPKPGGRAGEVQGKAPNPLRADANFR